jgi:hypothetical protein
LEKLKTKGDETPSIFPRTFPVENSIILIPLSNWAAKIIGF